MSERDVFGEFAGLTPIHCEGVSAVRKIGANMHVIYFGRLAIPMDTGRIELIKQPKLYVIVPIEGMTEGRKLADRELMSPVDADEMKMLWASSKRH